MSQSNETLEPRAQGSGLTRDVGSQHYDALIIGSGQGGGPLSTALVASGRKVALIERVHIGGCCLNEGCTPTKTMIASGRAAYVARRGPEFGVNTGEIMVDMVRVRQRKRDIVKEFTSHSEHAIRAGGVEIIWGEASFTGPKAVRVPLWDGGALDLSADLIVLDTGARPAMPPIPGIDSVHALDSTTIMELDVVPEHLIVVGGGYIGLEFGELFLRLGSKVTVVQMGPQIMGPREDPDIAQCMCDILTEDGMTILLETTTEHLEPDGKGGVRLTVDCKTGRHEITGSHLLVAAGRKPNTEALNLAAAGIETGPHGHIKVNDKLETGVPGVYAVGDCAGQPQFTHISYDDFRILRENLLHGGNRTTKDRLIPYTMFTDPQLGCVGINETTARTQGLKIRVAKIPMYYVARAVEVDEYRGMMKAVVDAETDQILGFAVIGIEGGEIMAMVELAMLGKLPYTTLRDGIFAHPTLAEGLNTLFWNFVE
jgi:pyruvate/2-oxoglutarate dehydrogenase complex dihydrolipoamide dehydrogenase (E3) component